MNDTVDDRFKTWVSTRLNDPQVTAFSLLQTLWSGYGQCFRFFSPKHNRTLVAKAVKPPSVSNHPKGWNDKQSHQRKLTSYQVERNFYINVRSHFTIPLPTLVAHDSYDDAILLIMTDLDSAGFDRRYETLNVAQAGAVLRYLARFHATFLTPNSTEKIVSGLWDRGTYWHLSTRQQELDAMPDNLLKKNARKLDNLMAKCPYQTIVHGDAKVANFCFMADDELPTNVAAVDFQYPGTGIGVQDVAYFIGSALSDEEQATSTQACLDTYFSALRDAITAMPAFSAKDADNVEQQWRLLYPVACADFQRFLEGWSPGHWKLSKILSGQTQQALRLINTLF